MNLDIKVPKVLFVGNSADPGNSVVGKVRQRAVLSSDSGCAGLPYGSAISLSVSLMILFGRAMVYASFEPISGHRAPDN